ncbi:glycosyl hydrolase [Pelagicoccus enzymogenes]|uniref:glycosyl hydrolase n=1 Tax=Pelagicoccus enzymogenes TaxID=2773457 RepID=UPI00280EC49D|nr:glycosyl hydrolase [Pelagicoccus enzymogenes]MDQ8201261.1 glycosyl hydrolase [Pelagicoccus enzymogenes]
MGKKYKTCLLPSIALLAVALSHAQSPDVFESPPQPYHPKTWMHALNGNISKAGFTKDFEAMADAGIGGAIFFSIDRGDQAKGPITFGTEAYWDAMVHAAAEAERVGIEFGLHNCDGWSSSGGTWITPELSMKRITWSESLVSGDSPFLPPAPGHSLGFYRDIAVLAWPAHESAQENPFDRAHITSSSPDQDASVIRNGDWDSTLDLNESNASKRWIQIDLEEPATLRALNLEAKGPRFCEGELLISNDGTNFTPVKRFGTKLIANYDVYSMAPVFDAAATAKHFRITFSHPLAIKRLELWSDPRFPDWIATNAMARGPLKPTLTTDKDAIIPLDSIRVLNRGEIPPQGISLPKGKWHVARFGYTSTGAINKPATPEGEGLECDKLSADILRFHFNQYVGRVAKMAQDRGIKGLRYSEIDSYEAGGQNWTENLDAAFEERFGYDLISWFPLVTGRVVESPRHAAAVLHEFRKLIADLMAENYFDAFTELCNEYGLESYIEPYGFGPFEELRIGAKADRVMGEFWVKEGDYRGRIPSAVSSGRIYGKKVISAEAFTSLSEVNWRGHPYHFKPFGDHIWAKGINEMTFHRFAHQPNTHIVPGMTMSSIGSHIDRTQTWWSNGGKAWFSYLTRGSYLLQQGVPESDILIHLGDQSPQGIQNGNFTNIPHGFRYDYVNTDVLVNRMTVRDGWLTLPEGTRYRALYLHDSEYIRLATLRRLAELVIEGATLISQKPLAPIGFSEWQHQVEFNKLLSVLWGDSTESIRRVGKGLVATLPITDATAQLGYEEDLRFDGAPIEYFSHRKIGDNELYYIYNDKAEFRTVEIDLRNGDGSPELWHIDTGTIEPITDFTRHGNRLKTTLHLEPHAVRFLLIRRDNNKPAFNGNHESLVSTVYQSQGDALSGPWSVTFDPTWKGPGTVTFDTLVNWTDRPEPGIKHYSGTALYQKTFTLSTEQFATQAPLYLDLGDVRDIAEVTVNGQELGTLWKPPYALDIRSALKTGENQLEIRVTNTWTNRLIGDESLPDTSGYAKTGRMVEWLANNTPPPPSERVTFSGFNFYETDRQLQPSGLIGPVRLIPPLKPQPNQPKSASANSHLGSPSSDPSDSNIRGKK